METVSAFDQTTPSDRKSMETNLFSKDDKCHTTNTLILKQFDRAKKGQWLSHYRCPDLVTPFDRFNSPLDGVTEIQDLGYYSIHGGLFI